MAGLGRRTKNRKGWYTRQDLLGHDLRRSEVRDLEEAGVLEPRIMDNTGHKMKSVLDRYSIVSTGDLQMAVRRVQDVALVVGTPRVSEKSDASLR
jgi:hypothetical protein